MTRWGKLGLTLCATAALFATAGRAQANLLTFEVIPAYAPNGPVSPNWTNYIVNGLAGIQQNMDIGSRAVTPAAYERVAGPVALEDMVYTTFNSWRGEAAPTSYGPVFDGEFGNRIHFGLHIVADTDMPFMLSDIEWSLDSNDVTNYFDQSGSFASATYSATRVGIDYGLDGVKGGGDDIILNAGQSGSTPVNELIYIGVGDGFFASEPGAPSFQDEIDMTLSDIYLGCGHPQGCEFDLVGTYSLPDGAGGRVSTSGTVTISIVPEPSTALMTICGGLLSLAGLRRRS
ncbi:MAG: PEP-CTERM sorting domain-containing protein [Planctomycetales bacterium]|nr:PEP-CTERM sorting domain-containing protein [Planctomycetales bacterium]